MQNNLPLGNGQYSHLTECKFCGKKGQTYHAVSAAYLERLKNGTEWEACTDCLLGEPPVELMTSQGDLDFELAFKVGLAGL